MAIFNSDVSLPEGISRWNHEPVKNPTGYRFPYGVGCGVGYW